MRFFARVFLILTLLIYIFVIGFQLIPKDGSLGIVETVFRTGRHGVTAIKQLFFQDNKLITFETPQGVDVPIPITVDLVPDNNRFTGAPQENKPKPTTTGGTTKTQNNPSILERIISFIPFIPNNNPPPVQTAPLSLSCSSTSSGNDIIWSATASGGASGGYSYSWAGQPYSNASTFRVSYTSSGTKTITVVARDAAGTQTERTCERTINVFTPDAQIPQTTSLSLSCSVTVNGDRITWRANPQNGSAPYRFEWGGNASGSTQDVTNTYTTTGLKTASLTVIDNEGRTIQTQCQGTPTITVVPPPPPPSTSVTSCNLDWCAPVVIRPDYKWDNLTTCVPTWTTDEIAQYAKMVAYGQAGNELPNTLGIPYESTSCWGALSLSKQRTYNDEVKAKATALGRRVYIANSFRFDIVAHSVMAQPGFNAAWLVRPATPHQAYIDFYANDTSPACGGVAGTCRLTYSRGVNREGRDTGTRLRDMIDASGGAGAYQNVVYYVARPGDGDTVGWAMAALADQRNTAYRAWRVNQARQIVQDGNFDFITLNHKFHFYKATNNWTVPAQSWLGGQWAPNVTALQTGDDTPFSNPPLNYTYSDYVQGWNALSRDLRAGGVPYMVQSNGGPFVSPQNFNDPTTSIDEAALIREAIEGADMVEMDYQSWLSPTLRTQLDQVVIGLEAQGVIVTKIRSECGYGNGTPTSCTTAQLNMREVNQIAQTPQSTTHVLFAIARITLLAAIISLLYARRKNTI